MRRHRDEKKSKIINIVLCVIIVLFLVVAFVLGSIYIEYGSTGEGTEETVTIEIEQGEGSWDIAKKLQEERLIRYPIAFYLKARNMGASGKLRYGTFILHKGAGLQKIIEDLTSGGAQKEEQMFTVPEGYTIEQIAKKLESEKICTESEFLQAVQLDYDYWFLESVPEDAAVTYKLQGFLFPNTYAISDEMTAEDIVTVMLEQFNEKFTKEMQDKMKTVGKTVFEVVIEASMIERKTMIDAERVMVAGVIKNRLEQGMRLQIDPTFLYPITNGLYDIEKSTYKHTEYDSPYNTYRVYGLPVGPIANPGRSSLEAALNPAEHEFLYYHTDTKKNDGSHIFTKTYNEHMNTQ